MHEDLKPNNPNSCTKQFIEEGYTVTVNMIYSIKNDNRVLSKNINIDKKISSRTWQVSDNYYFPTLKNGKVLHVFMEAYIE